MKDLPIQNLPLTPLLSDELKQYAQSLHPTIDQNNREIALRLKELSDGIAAPGVTDHGELTGLADDDHTRYIDKDGSRVYTDTGDGFKDEDDMASDSAVATASQQSIKAYMDARVNVGDNVLDNHDFATGDFTDWDELGSSWTVVSNKAHWTGASGGGVGQIIRQDIARSIIHWYELIVIRFELSSTSWNDDDGTIVVGLFGNSAELVNSPGDELVTIVLPAGNGGTNYFSIWANPSTGGGADTFEIDDVNCRRVIVGGF